MKKYHRVLTIAGSDSGGGAGIQADIKTISSLSCFASTAITSLTAQNTKGVQKIEKIQSSFIIEQIESVLNDIGADCVKIGMLQTKEIISAVANCLSQFSSIPIVLDPVMVATSGDRLLEVDAIEEMKKSLFSLVDLITPNKYEAEILSDTAISSSKEAEMACKKIANNGLSNVLIKGGDFQNKKSTDILYRRKEDRFIYFESKKIKSRNTHGTGCTFSSAIAAYIARGYHLEDSISRAKEYIFHAIESGKGYKIGTGYGPVNHLWKNQKGA